MSSLPWSAKGVKANPASDDEVLILDASDANPATKNKRVELGNLTAAIGAGEFFGPWTADHDAGDFNLINIGELHWGAALSDTFIGFTTPQFVVNVDDDTANAGLILQNTDGSIKFTNTSGTIGEFEPLIELNGTATLTSKISVPVPDDILANPTPALEIHVEGPSSAALVHRHPLLLTNGPDTILEIVGNGPINWNFNTATALLDIALIETGQIEFPDNGGNPPTPSSGFLILYSVGANPSVLFYRNDDGDIFDIKGDVRSDAANTYTAGLQNFAAVSLRIPASATPSVTIDGDIAYDSLVTDFSTGLIRFFGTEEQGVVAMPVAQFTTPTDGFVIAYNATNDEFELVAQSGGVQTPWLSDIDAAGFDLRDLSNLEFQDTTLAPGAAVRAIWADTGGVVFHVPSLQSFSVRVNTSEEYNFDDEDLKMQNNGLFGVENIVFADTLGAPLDTEHAIYVDTPGMILNIPLGDEFNLRVDNTDEFIFDEDKSDWKTNNLQNMGILSFTDLNTSLQQSTLDLQIDVATGGSTVLRVNNVTEYTFDAADADFIGNNIINATIDGDLNTILDVNETQQTVSVGVANTVLTSNGVGIAPTYEVIPGGGDVIGPAGSTDNAIVRFDGATGTQIQNGVITIDDDANVEEIRSLQFTTNATPPPQTETYIAVILDDFEINVTAGNNFKLEVDDTVEYEYSSSQADFNNNNLIMGAAYVELTSITSPGVTGSALVGRVFLDSGNSNHVSVIRNGSVIDLEAAVGQTPWAQDIDAAGFNLQNLSNLEFQNTAGAPVDQTVTRAIWADGTAMRFNVPSPDLFELRINGTPEYTFDASDADFIGNNIINAVIDASSGINTVSNIDETMQVVGTGVAETILTSNGVGLAPTYESLFPINFPENAGGNATVTQDISFSGTDRHSQQFTLIQDTTLTFSGTVADTTEYIDLFIVQDGTGGWTLTLPIGTINKAEVEAGVNLGAGEETFILLKFAFGTFYAFLQSTQAAGVTQTPWTSDINAANFSLDNLDHLAFDSLGTTAGITVANIFSDVGGITVNVPTGDNVDLTINGVSEYSFSATEADFQGNNLQDIPQILDSNGAELLIFTTTASAVNELTLVNAATLTPVEIQASGETNVDVRFVPKGTGTFYGNRESWAWPLTDETTLPTTGVKYTTEPAPYDMAIEDAITGLTTAGTGAALFTIDVLKEDSVNGNTFTTIFSTLPTIDASEFTSTTAATPPVISVSTWEKGRRLQLSIDTLDTDTLGRGAKIVLITHATAK